MSRLTGSDRTLIGRETRHADVERSEERTSQPTGENAERSDHHRLRDDDDELYEHANSFLREESGERSAQLARLLRGESGERSDQMPRDDYKTDAGSDETNSLPNAADFFPLLYEDDFDPAEVKWYKLSWRLINNNTDYFIFQITRYLYR